jgi:hypothetical protein
MELGSCDLKGQFFMQARIRKPFTKPLPLSMDIFFTTRSIDSPRLIGDSETARIDPPMSVDLHVNRLNQEPISKERFHMPAPAIKNPTQKH